MQANLVAKLEEIKEIKERLRSLPEKIRQSKERVQKIKQEQRNLKTELESIEITIRNEVYLIFSQKKSNKEERERKFIELSRLNPEFTQIQNEIESLDRGIRSQLLESEKLENTLSATKKVAELLVAELKALIPTEAYIELKILEQRFNFSQEHHYPTKLNL
jgi:chromosome segregation ATPase